MARHKEPCPRTDEGLARLESWYQHDAVADVSTCEIRGYLEYIRELRAEVRRLQQGSTLTPLP